MNERADPTRGSLDRLGDALELFLAAEVPDRTLLDARPDLRDLLEPLLSGASPPEVTHLGDFRIVREIGRGGSGIVYEATQQGLDRRVALKVLPAHLTLDAATVTRFLREARVMAQLDHPNIVRVHAVGSDQGCHFFAMDLIERGALEVQRRPVRETLEIGVQLADALDHAHQHGVVHRDVKPRNILLDDDGRPLLTDFGLARIDADPSLTRPGAVAGTLSYMAPEQLDGRPVDARTDVWGLGAALYQLLGLRSPFAGNSETEVALKIRTAEPTDLHRLDRGLPPDVCAVVHKALEKDADRRYQSAAALRDDLSAVLAFRPVVARPITRAERLRRIVRRHPWRAASFLAIASLLFGLAGFALHLSFEEKALAAGRAALRANQLEELVAAGYLYVFDDPARGLALFEEAARLDDTAPEIALGKTIGIAKTGGDWRSFVAQQPESVRIHPAVVHWIWAKEHPDLDPQEPAFDPLDLALAAQVQMYRGELHQQTDFHRALGFAEAAVVSSAKPRLYLYDLWAVAAGFTHDAGHCETVAAALVHLWPDSALAHNYAGYALTAVDLDRALREYRRATELDPQLSSAHGGLGWILMKRGEDVAAIESLRRAIELAPKYRQGVMNLAYVLQRNNRLAEAERQFARALEIDPGFEKAKVALDEVRAAMARGH